MTKLKFAVTIFFLLFLQHISVAQTVVNFNGNLKVIGDKVGEFADIDHLITAQIDHRFRGKLTT